MKRLTFAALAVTTALLVGCEADKQMNWDYGKAYHTVFENQKLNPNAGDDTPVVGMDGSRAALMYERHEKTAPEKKEQGSGSFEAFLKQK